MAWYEKHTGPPMTLGSAAGAKLRLIVGAGIGSRPIPRDSLSPTPGE